MTVMDEKEKIRDPLSNTLIALINGIEQISLNAYQTQQILFNANIPHKQIETPYGLALIMLNILWIFKEVSKN